MLLSTENSPSTLHDSLHIIFGNILILDGTNRSPRNVFSPFVGVYEWSSGKIVAVGDVRYEHVSSTLKRLYIDLEHSHPGVSSGLNFTEASFLRSLTPSTTAYKRRFGAPPPGNGTGFIASQCPFSATVVVSPREYSSSVRSEEDLSHVQHRSRITSPRANPVTSIRREAEKEVNDSKVEFFDMEGMLRFSACETEIRLVRLATSTTGYDRPSRKIVSYVLFATFIAIAQVHVLIRQRGGFSMENTKSLSLLSVGLQTIGDYFMCMMHLLIGIMVESWLVAIPLFVCVINFCIVLRWFLRIFDAKLPGRGSTTATVSVLFIFISCLLRKYTWFLFFALSTFWVWQILLNISEGIRKPLKPSFIAVMSVSRLWLPLYFWGCPRNLIDMATRPNLMIALAVWVMIQALILLSQYHFGPRWFIPERFIAENYDEYHILNIEES